MTRIYPGTSVTRTATFRDSNNDLTDPTTVKFFWKMNRGAETEVTPTNSSTGVYTVSIVPLVGGTCFTRWESTTPTIDIEESFPVSASQFSGYQ